jgi:hypothetical protein
VDEHLAVFAAHMTQARSLDRQRPGAAASLREGLELTLTVTRLGLGGKLLQMSKG